MNVNPLTSTFKFKVNPTQSTVTITPTVGTIVRWFAPTLIPLAGFFVFGSYLEYQDRKDAAKLKDPTDFYEKNDQQ